MEAKSHAKELPRQLLATLTVLFSFTAGITAAAGLRSALVARSEYHWSFELAMALFLLVTAANYARKLIALRDP